MSEIHKTVWLGSEERDHITLKLETQIFNEIKRSSKTFLEKVKTFLKKKPKDLALSLMEKIFKWHTSIMQIHLSDLGLHYLPRPICL